MQVVDEMAALNTTNLGGTFTALPVTSAGAVDNAKLVQITRADVYAMPPAATISAPYTAPLNFGLLESDSVLQVTIPLSNIGDDPLTITSIAFTLAQAQPISLRAMTAVRWHWPLRSAVRRP